MNRKRKACAKPGCPEIHTEDGMYCKLHKKAHRREYATTYAHLYDRQWRNESKKFLRGHPWCECAECREGPYRRKADCVDHIKAHRGDVNLFWDKSNWMAMNVRCNASKSVREEGGFGR